MNEKEIRRWCHDNGIEYIASDWGPRSDTGESAGEASYYGERQEHRNVVRWDMTGLLTGREQKSDSAPVWAGRTPEDREYIEALEDFFDPYIAMLPRPKGNLIREYMGMRRTQRDIGRSEGVTRSAVTHALKRALRDLTRLIAKDDPEWVPPADKRRRDYEGEKEAAERVFGRYWRRRRASYGAGEGS